MEYGIKKAICAGSVTISVSQCCHLGRIGDYPLMAARAALVAITFVNTHGGGQFPALAAVGQPPSE
jgi:LDH2 family malate/lactate/ureidoglycolate dehydrogenase